LTKAAGRGYNCRRFITRRSRFGHFRELFFAAGAHAGPPTATDLGPDTDGDRRTMLGNH
jgi:hypothetical protein